MAWRLKKILETMNLPRIGLLCFAFLSISFAALAQGGAASTDSEPFHASGSLLDLACGTIHKVNGETGWSVVHSRTCLTSNLRSSAGFAMLVSNGRVYRFDSNGNLIARKIMMTVKKDDGFKEDSLRVEVDGMLDGTNLYVKSIQRLK
ncbi:MAG TPA: hypothetical protein VKZ53_08395 [Candidatus Angelobacter sp.]|nr:hypothetical protein [Candidatus Angelobacter sp.]